MYYVKKCAYYVAYALGKVCEYSSKACYYVADLVNPDKPAA